LVSDPHVNYIKENVIASSLSDDPKCFFLDLIWSDIWNGSTKATSFAGSQLHGILFTAYRMATFVHLFWLTIHLDIWFVEEQLQICHHQLLP